jgi:hypothetical protein
MAYQKGLRTALQGALHATGAYWSSGVSVFSFKGVYRAPMGTTRREASCRSHQHSVHSSAILEPSTHHARAGKSIPAQADAITILDLAPLFLESFEIGHVGSSRVVEDSWWRDRGRSRYIGGAVWNAGFASQIDLRGTSEGVKMWPLIPCLGYNNCTKLRRFQSSHGQPAWRRGRRVMRPDVLALALPIRSSGPSSGAAPQNLDFFASCHPLLFITASNQNTT